MERVDGPTPAGGGYSEAVRVDGRIVEIVAYAADGRVLQRHHAAPETTHEG